MATRRTTAEIDRLVTVAASGAPAERPRARRAIRQALALDGYTRHQQAILCDRLIAERRRERSQASQGQL